MATHESWLKRLAKLRERATVHRVRVLPIIEVLSWSEADQARFRDGTDVECDELIAKHCGPQRPVPADYNGITQIVVCLHAPEYLRRDEDA